MIAGSKKTGRTQTVMARSPMSTSSACSAVSTCAYKGLDTKGGQVTPLPGFHEVFPSYHLRQSNSALYLLSASTIPRSLYDDVNKLSCFQTREKRGMTGLGRGKQNMGSGHHTDPASEFITGVRAFAKTQKKVGFKIHKEIKRSDSSQYGQKSDLEFLRQTAFLILPQVEPTNKPDAQAPAVAQYAQTAQLRTTAPELTLTCLYATKDTLHIQGQPKLAAAVAKQKKEACSSVIRHLGSPSTSVSIKVPGCKVRWQRALAQPGGSRGMRTLNPAGNVKQKSVHRRPVIATPWTCGSLSSNTAMI
ncbi:hypothetical protein Nmel_007699 [Mimus melanotis]